jgi:hypothetical protein
MISPCGFEIRHLYLLRFIDIGIILPGFSQDRFPDPADLILILHSNADVIDFIDFQFMPPG